MKKDECRITVFTPTYNRIELIANLYQSLRRQTFRDFEWLVVDDGSTDDTEQLIKSWIDLEGGVLIRYIKQANGGKCRAINHGLDLAEGELFFTVDSDDYLMDNALEKVNLWAEGLPEDEKFCGVVGNLGTSPTETPNTPLKEAYRDASLLERYEDYSDLPIDGERAFVFFRDIHREYKYPEYDGENFMTEAVAWNRMGNDEYKMRFHNDIICIYKYQEGGLTLAGNKLFLENPFGYGIWLREKGLFCDYSLKKRLFMYYTFYCDLCERGAYTKSQIARYISVPILGVFVLACFRKVIHWIKLVINRVDPVASDTL
ncbi:glycosyltransferase family 2 protein [Akkermansiaceae bacterium]|nr:glycosyltransferase family 2 protein [bacterium]MDB4730508.1 glycosyltransferase family 2 protein [Akkermansiaceae bacterium]MDB4753083.1 glycosyltransferase family 2 protein [bacterium]MDC0270363.1 glycosyltransferase family 2 protein [bacterium]